MMHRMVAPTARPLALRAGGEPTLLVVIVNYRTARLTIDCLESLAEELAAHPAARVVVIEGGSGDDSAAQLQAAIASRGWQSWVDLLVRQENHGFAYANNVALRRALDGPAPPDFVLLLNPDTVVRPGAVAALVDFLQKRPEVGIVGSRLEDPDGTPQRSAFRFHTLLSELEGGLRWKVATRLLRRRAVAPSVSENACPTDWVAGASMLVRREVFEVIGLLDEAYFLYYEELDFCLRAARAGWSCWYEPQSRVVHLVGQSSNATNAAAQLRPRPTYWFDSRRRYFIKNYGRLYALLTDAVWAVAYSLWICRSRLQRKTHRDPPRLLRDFLRNSVFGRGFRL